MISFICDNRLIELVATLNISQPQAQAQALLDKKVNKTRMPKFLLEIHKGRHF